MPIRTAASSPPNGLAQRLAMARPAPESPHAEHVAALFDRFRGPLFRHLLAFRLAPADVEEVIQEVFLALFQRLNGGPAVENLSGWIFGAAHNLGMRQSNRLRKALELEHTADTHDVADLAPNPEDRYAGCELSEHLRAVVDALPETDRTCLLLRSEGLRYREIAAILDISLGAVALSLSRSLARIARCKERCSG